MELEISKLVTSYESGQLSRRQLIRGLVMLVGATAAGESAVAQDAAYDPGPPWNGKYSLPTPVSVNHVQIMTSDQKKSTYWYQKMFNLKKLVGVAASNKNDATGTFLQFGDTQIVLRPGNQTRPVGTVNHFAFGFNNFDANKVLADLKKEGYKATLDAVPPEWPSVNVDDPDGLRLQLVDMRGLL